MKLKEALELQEVAPPGFEKAVKAMKKDKSVDNPYAVAWSMKKKGDKPSDDMDEDAWSEGSANTDRLGEMDPSQPYAPTSMADESARPCSECGMLEGHKPGCSMMAEADPTEHGHDAEDTSCSECGAPHGMKHDKGCPIGRDEEGEPERMGGLTRRERYYETTDFDGLALDENSLFDRFDTLVGHQFDGTFDARGDERSSLQALVKRVVGEMKLGVAGSFGATYDPDKMDDDEDYKLLAPKKAPEPEKSGVRVKSKGKKKKS